MSDLELVYGFVHEIRYKPLRLRARLPDADGMISPWAVVMTPRSKGSKYYDVPIKGEQVAMLLMDDGESALCLGSLFSEQDIEPTQGDVFQRTMPDGTVIRYDHQSKELNVDAVGHIGITAKTIDLKADSISMTATDVVMNATVTITQKLMVAMDVLIGILSMRTHRHKHGTDDTTPPIP